MISAMSASSGPGDSGSANPRPVGGGAGLGGLMPSGGHQAGRLVMTPARRAAILIGVPIVFLVLIAGGFSFAGNAGTGSFPVSASIPLPQGQLAVHLDGGSGTLRGSSALSATARVNGTVSYHLARPTLRTGAGTLSLTCPAVDEGNCSLNATVDVPAGTVLTATTDGGNITGSAITATRLTAVSGGGDVALTLASSPRSLQVTTDGGTVKIVVPPGKYIVSTNADGGTVSAIPSSAGAVDMISVNSGGGNISITTG